MVSILDKIIVTMDDALNKLLGVLKNIFYGRVEFHDGVCIAYDHVDEILKTFHLFRHLLDLSDSDSELYAFNVEISCSIQDLVRGTPMALSDIPLELKSFKIRMMNAIRNLLGIPIAPPDLFPTTTLHNPTSTDVERTIGDSVRVPAVDAGGVSVEAGKVSRSLVLGYGTSEFHQFLHTFFHKYDINGERHGNHRLPQNTNRTQCGDGNDKYRGLSKEMVQELERFLQKQSQFMGLLISGAMSGTKRILRSTGNETEKTKKLVGTLSLENGKGGGSYQSTVHVLQHSTQQSSICQD
ncbi:unnamed protein product [Cuscuta campestris]|uniref:Uncharacterized protein n=1 Tax=Cuscuta campestris TaxID=132261 RepID=A0A484LQH3_9ASTE|nr:unnamed protein product [Cuscuta campestris]